VAIPEWQTNASVRTEHHDRYSIFRVEYVQSLLRRGRDPLHMRLHTAAHVEQRKNVDGHVLAREMADRGDLTVHAENKIAGFEVCDRAAIAIEHLGIDARECNIALENGLIVRTHKPRKHERHGER
jgi:hypothetical protein